MGIYFYKIRSSLSSALFAAMGVEVGDRKGVELLMMWDAVELSDYPIPLLAPKSERFALFHCFLRCVNNH